MASSKRCNPSAGLSLQLGPEIVQFTKSALPALRCLLHKEENGSARLSTAVHYSTNPISPG